MTIKMIRPIAFSLLCLVALATVAKADSYPGKALLLQNGGTNPLDLFTISGDTISLTGSVTPSNNVTTWSLAEAGTSSYTQLVGIRSLYLVDTNGNSVTTGNPYAGGGFVSTSATGPKTNWVVITDADHEGYDTGASGKGFPDDSNWLVLANPTLAGKSASNNKTYGQFDMNTSLLNVDGTPKYYIGMDYITPGGTARGYITNFTVRTNTGNQTGVPEPTSLVLLSGLLPLTGLVLRRRK